MSILDEINKKMTPPPKVEPKPVPDDIEKKIDNAINIKTPDKFNEDEKHRIIDRQLEKFRGKTPSLKKREKNLFKYKEFDKTEHSQNTLIYLVIIGLIFLIVVQSFLPNESMYALIIIIGSTMFIPVGMLIGWVIFDIVMRCKILRKLTRRNWGIINFVGKGNRVVSKIKNFDGGLIWSGDSCWVLTRDRICHYSKNGNLVNDSNHEIDPNSVITLVETVPVVFVDMDSFEPLKIGTKDRETVLPSEIGNTINAWNDNQRAKMMANKKAQDYLLYAVIIIGVASAVLSFTTMNKVEELTTTVKNLESMIVP